MPLSELLRLASGKLESSQQKTTTSSTVQSSIPENDIVELVWENGQITMQGQSSRAKRSHSVNDFPMQTPRNKEKYIGNGTSSRIGKVGAMESLLNAPSPAVPSGEMDFNQDDDMVNWLNYPMDDNLQQDYPQLLPEVSGITMNEPSNQNSFASMEKRSSCNQTMGSSHNVSLHNGMRLEQNNGPNLSSSKTSLLSSWSSLPGQTSLPSLGSGVSDVMSYNKSNNGDAVLQDSPQGQPSAGGYLTMKMPKQNTTLPCSASSLSNFSFLSRHTSHGRAGIPNNSGMATSSSSVIEKIGHKEKSRAAIGSYPVESAFLPSSSSRKETNFHNRPSLDSSKVDLRPSCAQPPKESHPAEQSDALCRDDHAMTDASMHQVVGASSSKGFQDGEKTVEPVVASSSVCSGSSADRGSSDQTHNLKRKGRDNEESEYRSEMQDVEEESVGVKKAALARAGTGSKRSRAAEVHNLSERRRRDRINEKMRALQELIPNCNKADKASMLDEAIEYLKTLQLQVQIMSMGAGLCMPPMMFPAGMQHLHAAHMPHFPPMGVGMGMGMGFGMGMLDMNGGSPGCPIFPVPPMQRTHFPSPSVSGPPNFQGLAGSNLPIFGHPGQGHPMSVPRVPLVPFPGRPPASSSANVGAARMGFNIPCASPSSNSKDPMLDKNTQLKHNTDVSSSTNETPSQLHSTNEGFDQSNQSTVLQKGNQVPDDSRNADVKLSNGNAGPSREAGGD